MTIIGCRTTTYKVQDEVYIDIVETDDVYEAWIYKKNNGEKMIMFSCSKDQQPRNEFLEMVEANVGEYLAEYERGQEAWELFFEATRIYAN